MKDGYVGGGYELRRGEVCKISQISGDFGIGELKNLSDYVTESTLENIGELPLQVRSQIGMIRDPFRGLGMQGESWLGCN
jgi:hypothetical protein